MTDIERRENQLRLAARAGDLTLVHRLVRHGVNVNASDVLMEEGLPEKMTALHLACMGKHGDVAKELILCGADVNLVESSDGTPPLVFACNHPVNPEYKRRQQLRLVELLICRGAQVNTLT